jgi:hypothetical protein
VGILRKTIASWLTVSRQAGFAIAIGSLSAGRAWGVTFSDDFNRANSTNLGPNWLERSGDFFIVSNFIRSLGNGTTASATVVGFSATTPALTIEANYPASTTGVGHVALVGRYADASNNVYVKVQSSGAGLGFDQLSFAYGTDGSAWAGMTGGTGLQSVPLFTHARLGLTVAGSTVTATLDTNLDGTVDQTYTRGGLSLANLGTLVGMGMKINNVAYDADNFTAAARLAGDANLDGPVDVADLGVLATHYGQTTGAIWSQGDFNADGAVNVGDLGALATNYGLNSNSAAVATAASAATVPEPAMAMSMLPIAVVATGRRRRRSIAKQA